MTRPELFEKASGGNQDAFKFLSSAYDHFASVHTFIKSESRDTHEFITLMANTNRVFSLPFYVKHADALHIPVLWVIDGLEDGAAFSLVGDVAFITLGFEEARKLLVEMKGKE